MLDEIARLSGEINRHRNQPRHQPLPNPNSRRFQAPIQSDCIQYNKSGKCTKYHCPYQHNPQHVALCRSFIFNSCPHRHSLPDMLATAHREIGSKCLLRHTMTPNNVAICSKFNGRGCHKRSIFSTADILSGCNITQWNAEYCPFLHIVQSRSDPICPLFALNQYCPAGPLNCGKRHVYECIYWDCARLVCQKMESGQVCRLYHPRRKRVNDVESDDTSD